MKLFQSKDSDSIWQTVRYGLFDAPKHAGTIEERAEYLNTLTLTGPLFTMKHTACRSMAHLKKEFRAVFDSGGEGLVLRKAGSDYLHERTTQFLKVKCPW
jgi:DNA ligase-1